MRVFISLLLFGLVCVYGDVYEEGFFYGSPEFGTIKFISSADLAEDVVFNTLVSRPSAVCLSNDTVLFANNAPPVFTPWISSTSKSGDLPTDIFLSAPPNTPAGVTISSMTYDDISDQVFFMYRELNPNKRPVLDATFNVIQRYSLGDESPFNVYSVNLTAKIPTSFDIAPEKTLVYFTTNGLTYNQTNYGGGIYSIDYSGESSSEVLPIPQLDSINYFISSIQYADNQLFYIIHGPSSTCIYKLYLDNLEVDIVYNATAFNPVQIVTYVDQPTGNTNIWIRDNDGNFYLCVDEDCDVTGPVFSLPDGDSIMDFDVSADGNVLYYVGAAYSAVLQVDLLSQTMGSLVNGISSETNIWADRMDGKIYYSAHDRVDVIQSSGWKNFAVLPFRVDAMTGDSVSGQVVVSSDDAIYTISPSGDPLVLVNTTSTSIFAQDGVLYYSTDDNVQYGYISSIYACQISQCDPQIQESVSEEIHSVTLDSNGNIYYSTPSGIYLSTSSSPSVAYKANIMPFALSYSTSSGTLYFLDINEDTFTVFQCDVTDCGGTLNAVSSVTETSSKKFELNAWMVMDSMEETLYWASSSLVGEVYQVNITTGVSTLLINVGEQIVGLGISSDDRTLFVSDGTQVNQFEITSNPPSLERSCRMNFMTVGDIDVSQETLFWSDSGTGSVYQCQTNCTGCSSSNLVDTGVSYCSAWQFITIGDNEIYNQYGCGGIERVPIDLSSSPEQLKAREFDPIADLVVESPSVLDWALPYRYALLRGTVAATDQDDITVETLYSGTGFFSNLIVADDTFYWIDSQAAKIMRAGATTSPTDLIYQPAVGLAYLSAPAASQTPTATMTPSASPTGTATPTSTVTETFTNSPSPVPTLSISPTLDSTPASTTTTTMTPTTASTPDATISPTVSVTSTTTSLSTPTFSTPTTTASAGVTPNETPTLSFTTTMSNTVSPTQSSSTTNTPNTLMTMTQTPSPSSSGTVSPSTSLSSSVSPTGSCTASLTASTTPSATATLSLGATPSPTVSLTSSNSVSASVSRTNFFISSVSNTPGLPIETDSANEPVISRTTWEWIGLLAFLFLVLFIIPCMYCCWKRGVEREMAMSLRLPDE